MVRHSIGFTQCSQRQQICKQAHPVRVSPTFASNCRPCGVSSSPAYTAFPAFSLAISARVVLSFVLNIVVDVAAQSPPASMRAFTSPV